jgi:3-deoxy-D-manno-octulosonic-acid transferase
MNKIYNLLLNLLTVFALLFLPFIVFFSKKRRGNLFKRAGFSMKWKKKKPGEKHIWIHALSLGEVRSALPLVKALKQQYPENKLIFTGSTQTGFDLANKLFCTEENKLVEQVGYFPFDIGFIVRKTIAGIEPDAVIIVETDIWPNFLYEIQKRNIPVMLVNARLSARSLKGYLFFKSFFSKVFSMLDIIMVQSHIDADRFRQLSIPAEKIKITGNIKFDQPVETKEPCFISEIKLQLEIKPDTPVFLAGSTHECEEKILCHVFKRLLNSCPDLVMIVAPRNPDRCREISSLFLSKNIRCILFSDIQLYKHDFTNIRLYSDQENLKSAEQAHVPVILIDIMGILSGLYSLCSIAYIGGSLVKEGGHNPLEPAAFGKPVLFGPDMSDFLWISEQLIQNGGALQVDSEHALVYELEKLFRNPELQHEMGKKNKEVFFANTGAVENILEQLNSRLG